jgi:hypothetical protein
LYETADFVRILRRGLARERISGAGLRESHVHDVVITRGARMSEPGVVTDPLPDR